MGNISPISVPSNVSNLQTLPDVVRYLAAFADQITAQFNNLVGIKDCYGAIGATGVIGFTGSGNFGVSLVSAGSYYLAFRQPFSFPPSVVVTPATTAVIFCVAGVTTSGFQVFSTTVGNSTLINAPFHFQVKGAR